VEKLDSDESGKETYRDVNHFDPAYGSDAESERVLKLHKGPMDRDAILKSTHDFTRRMTEKAGVRVYNATIGGTLEIYPRVDFNSLFNGRAA